MSQGELKCVGSSHFLKKKFGNGYHLICVKKPTCISENVTNLLQQYIPDVQIDGDIGTELSYQLAEAHSKKFHSMFRELEDRSIELGVDSYGISLTTLEEVFMKVGSDSTRDTNDYVGVNGNDNLLDIENSAYGSKEICRSSTSAHFRQNLNRTNNFHFSKLCGGNSSPHRCNVVEKSNCCFVQKENVDQPTELVTSVNPIRHTGAIRLYNDSNTACIGMVSRFTKAEDMASKLPAKCYNFRNKRNGCNVSGGTVSFVISSSASASYRKFIILKFFFCHRIVIEYEKQLTIDNNNFFERIAEDFEQFIIRVSEEFLLRVNSQYLVGATISSSQNVTAWFNNQVNLASP